MFTALFFIYGLLQMALFAWVVRLWRETREPIALVLTIPQFFLIWDNMRVAVGPLIGHGELLYWLTWPSFWAHWLTGCWLVVASGAILRIAGIGFAQKRWAMIGFCLVTAALMLHDLPNFWTRDLYPVCEFDLVRYSGSVKATNRCFPDQPLVPSETPIASTVACVTVILAGLVLWRRRGFPWMFWGGLVMFVSATPPFAKYKLDNFGEVFIKGGAYWAIWYFTRERVRAGTARVARAAGAAQSA